MASARSMLAGEPPRIEPVGRRATNGMALCGRLPRGSIRVRLAIPRYQDFGLAAAVLAICLGVYGGFAVGFHWLMQPSRIQSPGLAAYEPAAQDGRGLHGLVVCAICPVGTGRARCASGTGTGRFGDPHRRAKERNEKATGTPPARATGDRAPQPVGFCFPPVPRRLSPLVLGCTRRRCRPCARSSASGAISSGSQSASAGRPFRGMARPPN